MNSSDHLSRRRVLRDLTFGIPLLAAGVCGLAHLTNAVAAGGPPLLSPDAPEAKAVKYVEDASKAKGALPGSTCANCALYQGKAGSAAGGCQIFTGKQVKAAGWCSSWAPQM
jgi:hypothetical protein